MNDKVTTIFGSIASMAQMFSLFFPQYAEIGQGITAVSVGALGYYTNKRG